MKFSIAEGTGKNAFGAIESLRHVKDLLHDHVLCTSPGGMIYWTTHKVLHVEYSRFELNSEFVCM